MSVCLRCDWRGATPDDGCPRCAAPLFRTEASGATAPARRRTRRAPRGEAVAARDPAPAVVTAADDTTAGAATPPSRRAFGWLPLMAVVVVVAVVSITTSERVDPLEAGAADDPPSDVPARPTGLTGSLLFSRFTPSAERVQLWRWDLERNTVEEGPIVRKPVQLVGASAVRQGHVGITWRRSDGTLEAGLLRSLDVDARPEPLIRGDLVAWSPRGARVSATTLQRTRPCPRTVAVRSLRMSPRAWERTFRMRTCGHVLSLDADGAVTYFTLRRGSRVHVAYGGISRPTIVLRDHALLGVSWAGDMIVQTMRAARPSGSSRGDDDDAGSPTVTGEPAYFNRRTTEPDPRPIPFTPADTPFTLGTVLAWSPNSFEALVVGALDGRQGIYLVDTVPADGIDPPRWLLDASGPTSATYTRDGVAVVLTDGDVYAIDEDGVLHVPMPLGAPLADGRVAWIP